MKVLRGGGLVAFPTETVYGLGADACNDDALRRIFEVKGRPIDHPLIVHIGSVDRLEQWGRELSSDAYLLASACWPGPLTMLVKRSESVSKVITGGRDTVGLRVPNHPLALELLDVFGGGIAAPSANRYGKVSPTTADHVRADLGDDVDFVLDGGPCKVGVESTIVDLTGEVPMLLRPGGTSVETIESVVGHQIIREASGPSRAPGMRTAHYAPSARVELVEESDLGEKLAQVLSVGGISDAPQDAVTTSKIGLLACEPVQREVDRVFARGFKEVVLLDGGRDASDFARNLYAHLREADHAGLTLLLVVPPPGGESLTLAIRDRLQRAAASSEPP